VLQPFLQICVANSVVRAETSLAFSFSYITHAVMSIVMGWLSDRLGRVRVHPRFFVGNLVLLMSQITSLWQFQINYALVAGLPEYFYSSVMQRSPVFVRSGFHDRHRPGGLGSGFFFPPLRGWLILSYGWRSAYIVMGDHVDRRNVSGFFSGAIRERWGYCLTERWPPCLLSSKNIDAAKTGLPLERSFVPASSGDCGAPLEFRFCRSTFIGHIAIHVQDLGFHSQTGECPGGHCGIEYDRQDRMAACNRVETDDVYDQLCYDNGPWRGGLIACDLWRSISSLLFSCCLGAQAVLRFSITRMSSELPSVS